MQPNLQMMLERVRGGDPSALGPLLRSYTPYLSIIARMQVGKRLQGKMDPDDLVQETFLEACRQFANFRGTSEGELTAWLRRIVAGQIALMLRRHLGTKGRDVRLERELVMQMDQSSQMMDAGLVGSFTSPSQCASRREQAVLLAEALERLPKDYREVIILRHLEQLPFAEVGARMGKSEDSVQKLWMRALKNLKTTMGASA